MRLRSHGVEQEVDGGVLHVAEGGYARFGSEVFMNSVTIHGVTEDGTDITPDRWSGGCIYNQVRSNERLRRLSSVPPVP